MYYCFVDVELEKLDSCDPLMLQYRYSQKLNRCLVLNTRERVVQIPEGHIIDSNDYSKENILLRTTCDKYQSASEALISLGFQLLETDLHIQQIEQWYAMNLTKRHIDVIFVSDVLQKKITNNVLDRISACETCFVKTKKKGFCLKVPSGMIVDYHEKWLSFIVKSGVKPNEELLITKYYKIKQDSLGNRETRHFVMGNRIINSSRAIHSLKHNVMPSHLAKASKIVDSISRKEDFPENYVLDIGEFVDEEEKIIDIVEINPISVSMCYVNNSIFNDCHIGVRDLYQVTKMGFEYCMDIIKNSELYHFRRETHGIYQYANEEHYCLEYEQE